MAMTNEELTSEVRSLKKQVKALTELVDYTVWQRALDEAGLVTTNPPPPSSATTIEGAA